MERRSEIWLLAFLAHSMSLSGAYSGFEVRGGREMWSGRSSAEGTRMEAPKAPTGWGLKFWHVLLQNGAF